MIKAQKSWVKHRDTPKYNVGDQVWLEGKNLRINQPTHKLAPRRYGPFKVTQGMSPVNYRLELPTQWSIHPVFHIDLLTPYRETITHGANYQRPPPDLVDNEEEYEVEAVLDSRKLGRRRCLQYLIKWKGYPDSDNQWIDKDDISADNKVREFKTLNPDKETHIRGAFEAHSPHPPHSQLFAFIDNHMSSSPSNNDNDTNFAEVLEYANTVFAPQGDTPPATRHLRRLIDLADTAIADALEERLGRLTDNTPTEPAPQYAEEGAEVHESEPPVTRDDNRNGVATGAVGESEEAMGPAQRTARQGRSPSNDSSLTRAQGLCGQCHASIDYCHGHTSPEPLPIRPREPPRDSPITTPASRRVVTPESRGSQSESLARNLINAILQHRVEVEDDAPVVREDGEDPATLPPPYPAEGMGVRGGRRGRRGQRGQGRGNGPVPVIDVETLQPPPPPFNAGRRPRFQGASIQNQEPHPPLGYEYNRGTAYVPFLIPDHQGRDTPARYIQIHMNDANPYVVGRMGIRGSDLYCGEIHAAPVHDVSHAPEPLTEPMLRLLRAQGPVIQDSIDSALERIQDRSLTGEVLRFRRFPQRIDQQREAVRQAEQRLNNLLMDQNLSEYRLREAHAVRRLVAEMVRDQRVMRYITGDPQARRDFIARQQQMDDGL